MQLPPPLVGSVVGTPGSRVMCRRFARDLSQRDLREMSEKGVSCRETCQLSDAPYICQTSLSERLVRDVGKRCRLQRDLREMSEKGVSCRETCQLSDAPYICQTSLSERLVRDVGKRCRLQRDLREMSEKGCTETCGRCRKLPVGSCAGDLREMSEKGCT